MKKQKKKVHKPTINSMKRNSIAGNNIWKGAKNTSSSNIAKANKIDVAEHDSLH